MGVGRHTRLTSVARAGPGRKDGAVLDRHEPEAEAPSPPGYAEVRIVSATPDAARRVADTLRHRLAGGEQRGCPAPGKGARLHLTVDTTRTAGPGLTDHRPALAGHRPPAEEP
ncbi:hypothetical protein AB1388_18615 [Streptomyces hydrogenans]|uniref:hypothetical protein n=1 Tax=Streptomyces hydrogenans TaxID=1873719 RepID=UPI00345CB59F